MALVDAAPTSELLALREMRKVRRAHKLGGASRFDGLYATYVVVLAACVGALYVGSLLSEQHTTAGQLRAVRTYSAALLGVIISLAWSMGARSGGHGGPLVFEQPDVAYVLLSPIRRWRVVVPAAIRRIVSPTLTGILVGAVAGYLAALRLPGTKGSWALSGAIFGGCLVASSFGIALAVSSFRPDRRLVSAACFLLVGGSVYCLVAHASSPLVWAGRWALLPLFHDGRSVLLLIPAVALVGVGVGFCDRISLEAADRRASLSAGIKFGLLSRDFRYVIQTSRALAQERPRRRPWIQLPRGSGSRLAVGKRDLQDLLRWPGARVLRMTVMAFLLGIIGRELWSGIVWSIIPGGVALWLIGIDAADGLAAEIEHPNIAKSFPISEEVLMSRHVAAPVAVVAMALVIAVSGFLVYGPRADLIEAWLAGLLAAATTCVAAGAITNIQKPKSFDNLLTTLPDLAGLAVLIYLAIPPAVAVCGLLPLWEAGVATRTQRPPLPVVGLWSVLPLALAICTFLWVRAQAQDGGS